MGSLFEEVKKTAEETIPFHMPGHKRNIPENFDAAELLLPLYKYDMTEILGTDDLHHPEGILKEAMERASKLYHAKESFFLVGGSTVGVLAAISAVVPFGGKMLLPRCSHKSVYHALALRHITPVFMESNYDAVHHFDKGVSIETVTKQLSCVDAVFITSPTYEGILQDVATIAELAHKNGLPLIVDSAHGAHLGLLEDGPKGALEEGADVVIHSLHKTLPSPTMTGLLHIGSNLVDVDRIRYYLGVYQSSSPSYPLMIGMDACLAYLEHQFKLDEAFFIKHRRWLAGEMKKLTNVKALDYYAGTLDDPCKMVIYTEGKLSGEAIANVLRANRIEPELIAATYVLLIVTVLDKKESYECLLNALQQLEGLVREQKGNVKAFSVIQPKIVEPIWKAVEGKNRRVILAEAKGCVSAGMIALYPPGQPLILPGEEFSKELVEQIEEYNQMGLNVTGLQNGYVLVR